MSTAQLTLGLAPGKNNPDISRASQRRAGDLIAETHFDVLFTTEMGDGGDDTKLFDQGLGEQYRPAGKTADSENPIFYDNGRMNLSKSYVHNVKVAGETGGRQYYYAGVSPTRSYAVAVLTPQDHGTGPVHHDLKAKYIGAHFTAFGFSGHFKRGSEQKKWVDKNWRANWEQLNEEIDKSIKDGWLVFLGGDFNRSVTSIPKFSKNQEWMVAGGIDGILMIPNKKGPHAEFHGGSRTRHIAGYDHPFRYRTVKLTGR